MEEYKELSEKLSRVNIGMVMASIEKDEQGEFKEVSGGVTDGQNVKLSGIITARKNKTTKNNTQMAFIRLEDLYGGIEAIIFPKVLTQYNSVLKEEELVLLEGRISIREDEEPKLLCEKASLLSGIKDMPGENAIKSDKPPVAAGERVLYVRMGTMNEEVLKMTVRVLEQYPGNTPVCFFCADTKKRFFAPQSCRIDENSDVISELLAIFGEDNVKFG